MPKYTLRPIDAVVFETYKENSNGLDRTAEFPHGLSAELTILASTEEECLAIRTMITHYPSWEVISVEE